MQILYRKTDLDFVISELRSQGKTIGFVPTMGALHQGHLSLIAASRHACDITVCSIFVNPTQFNDKKDLERYPRTPGRDLQMLEGGGCDIVFMPEVEEMYPEPDTRQFDFGYIGSVLDGAARPGHFNGVAQIVSKLFDAVKPDKAFFGQKDYQQVMIVREMVRQLRMPVEVVPCPILREPDGLAMSSRNTLLSSEERAVASLVPKLMQEARQRYLEEGIGSAKDHVAKIISENPLMKLDYFVICDKNNLHELQNPAKEAIALIAVFVGKIRLIDNLLLD